MNIKNLFILVLGSGFVYKLSYLPNLFYVPMQTVMGLSHTQIGTLLSLNGALSTSLFVLGGYLTDRFSPKIMVPLGLGSTGVLGLYLATLPPFPALMVLFPAFAIASDTIYWSGLIKAFTYQGDQSQQGRLFGILESGRGAGDVVAGFIALNIFALLGSQAFGLKMALTFFSVSNISIAIWTYFAMRPMVLEHSQPHPHQKSQISFWANLKEAAQFPQVWLMGACIFCSYLLFNCLRYFIPYTKEAYGLSVYWAGIYSVVNIFVLRMLGGASGGFVCDHYFGSPSRYLRAAFLSLVPFMVVILSLPHVFSMLFVSVAMSLCFGLIVFTLRGVYWAPMREVRIPGHLQGICIGMASCIGYSPDAFVPLIFGRLIDTYGMWGYRFVFFTAISVAIAGALFAQRLLRFVVAKHEAVLPEAIIAKDLSLD